jgi:hypothetical protein
MSGLGRVGAAARRGAARLVPAGRRYWVEAVWAEAPEVPPGLRRLAWRAGGVRLIAREALMRRRIGSAMLFAVAAALVAWAAWPGSPDNFATSVDRVDVITMVLLLAGLALLARRVFGPAGDSRVARFLRAGGYVAILALIAAKATVEQFTFAQPRGGAVLRLYRLISGGGFGPGWPPEIIFLAVMALYAAAILWMTSRRSRVAPATLAIGTGAGIVLGVVMYAVAPLGLAAATNPWLPGFDPFVVLAWILLFCAPVAAAVVAERRYTASASPPPVAGARARQVFAAGLLTNLVGALFVTVLGTGTIALMLKAAWLRTWLYHGQHLLFGVTGLRLLLRGDPGAITYSHELTAGVDAATYLIICMAFPLIALGLTGWGALSLRGDAATGPAGPRRGGGGPPGPEPAQDPPDGAQLTDVANGDAGLLSRHQQGPGIGQDRLMAGLADAAVRQNLTAAQADAGRL